MKLVRFGEEGHERPGILDVSGRLRDLSPVIPEIDSETLAPAILSKLLNADLNDLPIVPEGVRLGPCIKSVGNFVAIGLNYLDHAHETSSPIPTEPIIFFKARTSICGPYDRTILPLGSEATDWEVELAAVIGTEAYCVGEDEALSYVAGYCVCEDLSERKHQLSCSGGQWGKGKSFPTFGPIGPWLVTPDEIANIQDLHIWLDLNGRRVQSSSTAQMIFTVAHLVSYVSRFIRLMPGDVITTGTPPGVGMAEVPPRYLKAGDVVQLGVAGLGTQRHEIVAASPSN